MNLILQMHKVSPLSLPDITKIVGRIDIASGEGGEIVEKCDSKKTKKLNKITFSSNIEFVNFLRQISGVDNGEIVKDDCSKTIQNEPTAPEVFCYRNIPKIVIEEVTEGPACAECDSGMPDELWQPLSSSDLCRPEFDFYERCSGENVSFDDSKTESEQSGSDSTLGQGMDVEENKQPVSHMGRIDEVEEEDGESRSQPQKPVNATSSDSESKKQFSNDLETNARTVHFQFKLVSYDAKKDEAEQILTNRAQENVDVDGFKNTDEQVNGLVEESNSDQDNPDPAGEGGDSDSDVPSVIEVKSTKNESLEDMTDELPRPQKPSQILVLRYKPTDGQAGLTAGTQASGFNKGNDNKAGSEKDLKNINKENVEEVDHVGILESLDHQNELMSNKPEPEGIFDDKDDSNEDLRNIHEENVECIDHLTRLESIDLCSRLVSNEVEEELMKDDGDDNSDTNEALRKIHGEHVKCIDHFTKLESIDHRCKLVSDELWGEVMEDDDDGDSDSNEDLRNIHGEHVECIDHLTKLESIDHRCKLVTDEEEDSDVVVDEKGQICLPEAWQALGIDEGSDDNSDTNEDMRNIHGEHVESIDHLTKLETLDHGTKLVSDKPEIDDLFDDEDDTNEDDRNIHGEHVESIDHLTKLESFDHRNKFLNDEPEQDEMSDKNSDTNEDMRNIHGENVKSVDHLGKLVSIDSLEDHGDEAEEKLIKVSHSTPLHRTDSFTDVSKEQDIEGQYVQRQGISSTQPGPPTATRPSQEVSMVSSVIVDNFAADVKVNYGDQQNGSLTAVVKASGLNAASEDENPKPVCKTTSAVLRNFATSVEAIYSHEDPSLFVDGPVLERKSGQVELHQPSFRASDEMETGKKLHIQGDMGSEPTNKHLSNQKTIQLFHGEHIVRSGDTDEGSGNDSDRDVQRDPAPVASTSITTQTDSCDQDEKERGIVVRHRKLSRLLGAGPSTTVVSNIHLGLPSSILEVDIALQKTTIISQPTDESSKHELGGPHDTDPGIEPEGEDIEGDGEQSNEGMNFTDMLCYAMGFFDVLFWFGLALAIVVYEMCRRGTQGETD